MATIRLDKALAVCVLVCIVATIISFLPTIAGSVPTGNWDVQFETVASLTKVELYIDITNLQDSNDDFPFKMLLSGTDIDLNKATVRLEEWDSRNREMTDYATICSPYSQTTANSTVIEHANCTQVVSGSHVETDWFWTEKNIVSNNAVGGELRNQWEEVHIKKGETKRYRVTYYFNELRYSSRGFAYMDVKGTLYYDFTDSSWWDESWLKRRNITLTENAGQALWNYTMMFNITHDTAMMANFSDLRFANETNATLPHWIENYTDSEYAYIWVRLGYVGPNAVKNITMYYCNPEAPDVSDIDAVSVISEDCEDNDDSQWTTTNIAMDCDDTTVLAGTRSLMWNSTAGNAQTQIVDYSIPENYTMVFWVQQDATDGNNVGPILANGTTDRGMSFWYQDRPTANNGFYWWWDAGGYKQGFDWIAGETNRIMQVGTCCPLVTNGVKTYVDFNDTPDTTATGYGDPTDPEGLDRVAMSQSAAQAAYLDQFTVFKSTGDRGTEPTYVFGEEETNGGSPGTDGPQYSNNLTMLTTPQVYDNDYGTFKAYGFQIDWENANSVTFEADFTGANTNYTSVSNTSTTTYWINFTNENITTASHTFKWFAKNVTSENVTEPVTYVITINSTPSVGLVTTPPTDITYGTPMTASCRESNGGSPEEACKLDRNSTDVTATENDTAIVLGAGHWNWTSYIDGSANYSAVAVTTNGSHYVVNPAPGTSIDMYLNGTENADRTVVWPSDINATCVINRATENTFTMLLTRVPIGAQVGTAIEYNDDLAAGGYNVTCNYTTANYTGYQRDHSLTINNAPVNLTLYINGTTSADCTGGGRCIIYNGSRLNYTITANESVEVWLALSYDGVCDEGAIQNQTAPYENFTASNCTSLGGDPFVTATVDQTNYTRTTDTIFLKMFDLSHEEDYEIQLLESQEQTITIDFDVPIPNATFPTVIGEPATNLIAVLIWNGTSYGNDSVTMTQNNTHANIILSRTFDTPNITDNNDNVTFFWNYSYDGKTNRSTTPVIQDITKPQLLGCGGISNTTALIINLFNETNITQNITGTMNMLMTFDIDGTMYTYNATNYTTSHHVCLYPIWGEFAVDAQIQYFADGYDERSYFLTQAPFTNVTQTQEIYMLTSALASKITFTVRDASGNVKPNVYISVQRQYPELDTYRTVAMMRTDENGQSNAYLRAYDVFHRFVLEEDNVVVHIVPDMLIVSTETTLAIPASEVIEYFSYHENIAYSCTDDNTTRDISCDVYDTSGLTTQACLDVDYIGALTHVDICHECGTGNLVALNCTIPGTYNGTFSYELSVNLTGDVDFIVLEKAVVSIGITRSEFGVFGLFMAFILIGTMTFAGMWIHPVIAILFMSGSMGISIAFGLIEPVWGALISVMLIGAIIVYRLRR